MMAKRHGLLPTELTWEERNPISYLFNTETYERLQEAIRERARVDIVENVIQMKERYAKHWRDKPESYWFARLLQECGELGSSLVGDTAHNTDLADHELSQIASICLNWLDMRKTMNSG